MQHDGLNVNIEIVQSDWAGWFKLCGSCSFEKHSEPCWVIMDIMESVEWTVY